MTFATELGGNYFTAKCREIEGPLRMLLTASLIPVNRLVQTDNGDAVVEQS